LFGSAIKALCSGRANKLQLAFSAPFFGSFFGRAKNEQRKMTYSFYYGQIVFFNKKHILIQIQ